MCASPGAGCKPQSRWGSFYIVWVQPGQAVLLLQCGESRSRLQSTFSSALSLPLFLPPRSSPCYRISRRVLPPSLAAFFTLSLLPTPETWSRLSSGEWEMGRPVLASERFENLRSAVNPRP